MYDQKREALAKPFFASMKQELESDEERKPEKVYVDFTDSRRMLRAVVPVELAVSSEGQEVNDAMERSAMLSIIDAKWTEHLRNLDEVKEGIGLRAYGQRDPVIEYKMEAFKLFSEMIEAIGHDVVSFVFRAGPLVDRKAAPSARPTQRRLDPRKAKTRHDAISSSFDVKSSGKNEAADKDPTAKSAPVIADDKVGRNDTCPCGSGKKFKHCHGR
jgi:preprotein translocase subunit SecA